MRKIIQGFVVSSVFLGALASESHAGGRFEKRFKKQQDRIQQGVNSGALTDKEAAGLQKQQEHIQNVENRLAQDGNLSVKDKARVEKMQNRASRRIHRQKHDRQKQF